MGTVVAAITTSLDGYITGPDDGPGHGLGTGGERLHYWVFGGPWTYDEEPRGEPRGLDKEFLDQATSKMGAVIAGRGTYEAAGAWGGSNPWGIPFFVVTHRTDDAPPAEAGFDFVGDLATALRKAQAAVGERDVHVMGGADIIRQALAAGEVDELTVIVAPVVLGGGKRLFDGSEGAVELDQVSAVQSDFVTYLTYRVVRR